MITVFRLDFCKTFSVPNKFEDTPSYALNRSQCEIGCVIALAVFHHLPPHSLSCLTQVVSHMRGHTPTMSERLPCLTWFLTQMRGHTPTKSVMFDLSCIPNERTHTYKVYPVWPKFYPKREDTHLRNLSCLSWVVSQMRGHIPTKYILFDPSFILNERTHKYVMFDSWTVEV